MGVTEAAKIKISNHFGSSGKSAFFSNCGLGGLSLNSEIRFAHTHFLYFWLLTYGYMVMVNWNYKQNSINLRLTKRANNFISDISTYRSKKTLAKSLKKIIFDQKYNFHCRTRNCFICAQITNWQIALGQKSHFFLFIHSLFIHSGMHEKALNWACIPYISLVLNAKKNKDFNCNMPWWTWWNKSYYYY
jgi:hypothetical protein